jgi:hypothetical protein
MPFNELSFKRIFLIVKYIFENTVLCTGIIISNLRAELGFFQLMRKMGMENRTAWWSFDEYFSC